MSEQLDKVEAALADLGIPLPPMQKKIDLDLRPNIPVPTSEETEQ